MSTKGPKKPRKVIRDSIRGITDPAIKRILYRSGIRRIGKTMYEEIRGILKFWVEKIMKDVVTFTEYARRKTVSIQDLEDALESNGISLAAGLNENAKTTASLQSRNARGKSGKAAPAPKSDEVKNPHRFRPGTVALREIRRHQKNSDCLEIPKLNFERVCREIAQDLHDDLRFSDGVFDLLHLAAEDYLVSLCEAANKCALHASRETVFSKDLQLVRDIRDDAN